MCNVRAVLHFKGTVMAVKVAAKLRKGGRGVQQVHLKFIQRVFVCTHVRIHYHHQSLYAALGIQLQAERTV